MSPAPPPPERQYGPRPGADWASLSAQLRDEPDTWVETDIVATSGICNAIRRGDVAAMRPELGFRVVARKGVLHAVWSKEHVESAEVIEQRRLERAERARDYRARRRQREEGTS